MNRTRRRNCSPCANTQRGEASVIYKEYVDHVSGDVEHQRAKRTYRELMEDAGRRSFDCVLVWKYDRFARSLSILVSALQQFSTLGIDFISYTRVEKIKTGVTF